MNGLSTTHWRLSWRERLAEALEAGARVRYWIAFVAAVAAGLAFAAGAL